MLAGENRGFGSEVVIPAGIGHRDPRDRGFLPPELLRCRPSTSLRVTPLELQNIPREIKKDCIRCLKIPIFGCGYLGIIPPKKIPIFGGSGHPTGKNSVLVDGDPEGTVSLCPLNNVPGLEFLTPSSHPSLSLDPGGIQGAGNLLTGMRGKDDPTGIRLLVLLPWDLELEKGECGSFPAAGLGFLGKILLGKQWEKELYPKSRCSSAWHREYRSWILGGGAVGWGRMRPPRGPR